jgi:hypothetical protein
MFIILRLSRDNVKNVLEVLCFKKLNSKRLIIFFSDSLAKPEFSIKKFFNVILKFLTFPP